MKKTALIDGDEIAFNAALKCQDKIFNVYSCDNKYLFPCKSKQEAIESLDSEKGFIRDSIVLKTKEAGYTYLDNIISKILFRLDCDEFKLFLNGDHNFRKGLATLKPYKGNRSEKPFYFQQMKNYLLEKGAESISFLESDDLLAINHNKASTIICSSDKDLRTVPGYNYNIKKESLIYITDEMSLYNFYTQLALGDSVDNIPKPYGLGQVAVNKALEPLLLKKASEYEYYNTVRDLYVKKLGPKTKWYKENMDIDEILWEIGNLLWMHRTTDLDERWNIYE